MFYRGSYYALRASKDKTKDKTKDKLGTDGADGVDGVACFGVVSRMIVMVIISLNGVTLPQPNSYVSIQGDV